MPELFRITPNIIKYVANFPVNDDFKDSRAIEGNGIFIQNDILPALRFPSGAETYLMGVTLRLNDTFAARPYFIEAKDFPIGGESLIWQRFERFSFYFTPFLYISNTFSNLAYSNIYSTPFIAYILKEKEVTEIEKLQALGPKGIVSTFTGNQSIDVANSYIQVYVIQGSELSIKISIDGAVNPVRLRISATTVYGYANSTNNVLIDIWPSGFPFIQSYTFNDRNAQGYAVELDYGGIGENTTQKIGVHFYQRLT